LQPNLLKDALFCPGHFVILYLFNATVVFYFFSQILQANSKERVFFVIVTAVLDYFSFQA